VLDGYEHLKISTIIIKARKSPPLSSDVFSEEKAKYTKKLEIFGTVTKENEAKNEALNSCDKCIEIRSTQNEINSRNDHSVKNITIIYISPQNFHTYSVVESCDQCR
jgi:hypothetical protein